MKAAEATTAEMTAPEPATTESAVQHASPATAAFGSRRPASAITKRAARVITQAAERV